MKDLFEYDVFLSFASSDEEFVKPIWQEMSLSGLRVFWSDETLKENIGQSFFSVIQDALTHSRHFVLICTPSSMKSNWVREEYEAFFSQCYIPSGRERRLILFSGKDFDKKMLPTLLRNIQVCESAKEMISILGGVNIQQLINENRMLKKQLETTNNEIQKLKKELSASRNENRILQDKIQLSNTEKINIRDELNIYKKKLRDIQNGSGALKTEKAKSEVTKAESSYYVNVDAQKCDGCEECVEVCPTDVFKMKDGKSVPVIPEECLGCESCVEVCYSEAITVEETQGT